MYIQKLHHVYNITSPDDGLRLCRKYLENGRFINQFPPNIIRSIRQLKRINKQTRRQKNLSIYLSIYPSFTMFGRCTSSLVDPEYISWKSCRILVKYTMHTNTNFNERAAHLSRPSAWIGVTIHRTSKPMKSGLVRALRLPIAYVPWVVHDGVIWQLICHFWHVKTAESNFQWIANTGRNVCLHIC